MSYSNYIIMLLEKEVDKGDAEAMFQLGRLYSNHPSEETYDPDKAIPLLRQAIALGHKEAKGSLGRLLMRNGHEAEAVELLKDVATNGEIPEKVQAQLEVGDYFLEVGNHKEAIKWLTEAASSGVYKWWAWEVLAKCYKELGGKKNIAKAQKIYEELAAEGHPVASLELGRLYYTGATGIDKDYTKAVANLTKSIGEGENEGLLGLASIYDRGGHGVSRDLKAAYLFYYLYDLLASEYYDEEDREYISQRLNNIGECLSWCNGGRSIDELIEEWLPEPLVSILVRSLSY